MLDPQHVIDNTEMYRPRNVRILAAGLLKAQERIAELEKALEPVGALLARPGMYVGPDSPWVEPLQNLGCVLRKGAQT